MVFALRIILFVDQLRVKSRKRQVLWMRRITLRLVDKAIPVMRYCGAAVEALSPAL
jgi:hypothetical protein